MYQYKIQGGLQKGKIYGKLRDFGLNNHHQYLPYCLAYIFFWWSLQFLIREKKTFNFTVKNALYSVREKLQIKKSSLVAKIISFFVKHCLFSFVEGILVIVKGFNRINDIFLALQFEFSASKINDYPNVEFLVA